MIKTISVEEALALDKANIVDTRSPKEFEEDNIPGSINKPLFSNEERAIVGTLYKNNQVDAYQKGIEIYTSKVISFIEEFKELRSDRPIIIYCARGGMRSKVITELVTTIGLDVYQLEGGYKNFRKYIREYFENYSNPFKMIILQGLAGIGKTDLIKKLDNSIDLEGIAKHRSSLFGALGLKPVKQKRFESRLWNKIENLKKENVKIVFVEGEAKKIGDINVPSKFFKEMEKSIIIHVKSSIKNRSIRIVRDYFTHGEDEKIKSIISSLKVAIGNEQVEKLNKLVDEKNYEPVAKFLLEEYYDSKYTHAIEEIKFKYTINNDDIKKAIEELKEIAQKEA